MKDFFHSNGFKALLGIVCVLFGVILYTAGAGGSVFSDLLGFVAIPMQKVSTVVTNNAAVAAKGVTRSASDLQKENDELKKEIEALNTKLIDYYQIKQENEQFRAFLELKQDNKDFIFVSGAVVGRDPNDLFYSFTVDKGSLAGIRVNNPVITNSGVVGWVSSVSSTFCRVTTILSADTSISAIDKVNRESGVTGSDIKLADQGLLKLRYLTAETTVKQGDIIVTSGLGGIYPKDLPIGKVESVGPEGYDVSYSALVKPLVDVKNVQDVFIITDFLGQGEVLEDFPEPSPQSGASSSEGG